MEAQREMLGKSTTQTQVQSMHTCVDKTCMLINKDPHPCLQKTPLPFFCYQIVFGLFFPHKTLTSPHITQTLTVHPMAHLWEQVRKRPPARWKHERHPHPQRKKRSDPIHSTCRAQTERRHLTQKDSRAARCCPARMYAF